jgi:hypothetical protein
MERRMEQDGLHPVGAPWEHCVTDPAEHRNPADWRTGIYGSPGTAGESLIGVVGSSLSCRTG